ncbi:fimbrial protein, partial [Escherichia coli]
FELLLCHGTVCVVGKIRDLILQLSKSSIYSTKPTDDISTSFYATEPNTDNSMVVTSNSNVGIKIYDKNNKEIKVNGGELPTDMGKSTVYGEKSGSVTFSAAPASLTGARPAPGQFTATATITVEIVR